jgi:hypothetical protein
MRHVRSSVQAGGSASHTHIVEQWGNNPVRPYGEWRFPYRPYSAPYSEWGPPNNYLGGRPFIGGGFGGRAGIGPGAGIGLGQQGINRNIAPYAPRNYPGGDPRTRDRPYDDGRYPSHRRGDDPTRRFEPYTPRGY